MPTGKPRQAARPSRKNLFRVWLIRSILLVTLMILGAWLYRSGGIPLPWIPLALLLGAMLFLHLLLLLRLRREWPVGEPEFFANLLLDVLFLAALLYFSGGPTNPLVSYFLIPLIISAAVLRPAWTWGMALLTMSCYTLLLFHHQPLDVFSASSHGTHGGMNAHFIGMWINFAFSAVLIAWFVVRMAGTMRGQERAISEAREEGLRNEQIISVASIAAGTAHELRTPLATMTVLADELEKQNPELSGDLQLLQQQLERCDRILRELISATADSSHRNSVTVEQVIRDLLEKWNLVRPEARLDAEIDRLVLNCRVDVDQSFHHALLSFLHNAADASPQDIHLAARADGPEVLIVIADRGPGIPPEIAGALGRRYISRKEGGLGLGVLLSSASIERLDGSVTLLRRRRGGTRLEIRLPAQGHDRGR